MLGENTEQAAEVVIIGAGLGGLLSAAELLERGKRVLIVERLKHCGGRFTAKSFQGVQLSTGALHLVPFGSSGVLSQVLQRLSIRHRLIDVDVFGSFHLRGRQYRSRGLLGVISFLGLRQFALFFRIGCLMFLGSLPEDERDLTYEEWLSRKIDLKKNRELVAFFASISRFALSLELNQVRTQEIVQTTRHMFRFGAPGIVEGGCARLTEALKEHILAKGARLWTSCEVQEILQTEGHVSGVRLLHKESGREEVVNASLVVSDIGPRATRALVENVRITQNALLKGELSEDGLQEAIGLKVHILSDISFIPHRGILYCLDTQRIAGLVQPTNSDPGLAPPGKHLLISHQVIRSKNIEEEKELALSDLRTLIGKETFEKHCRVLTMGTYRGEWPVNRLAQGEDLLPLTEIKGLYLVGDAVKPSGYLMVEGVAQSVNCFLDLLDEIDQQPKSPQRPVHRIPPGSRWNFVRWLWTAPGNGGKQ